MLKVLVLSGKTWLGMEKCVAIIGILSDVYGFCPVLKAQHVPIWAQELMIVKKQLLFSLNVEGW